MKKMVMTGFILVALISVLPLSAEQKFKTFKDSKKGYTFTYTNDFKRQPLQSSSERARFAVTNQFMLPVIVSNVYDNDEGLRRKDLAEDYMAKMEKSLKGTSGFEMISKEKTTLTDGTKAVKYIFHWLWVDGKTSMENVCVSTLKGDEIITLTGISVTDFQLTQDMENICLSLRLD